jgi:hypothetical protein
MNPAAGAGALGTIWGGAFLEPTPFGEVVAIGATAGFAGWWVGSYIWNWATGENFLDQLQKAKELFRTDREFREFCHREFKPGQRESGGERDNPDLTDEQWVEALEEWFSRR